ncbi:hypothetical protein DFH08DRAFT_656054, partial [Mycena albidolilacea]
IFYQNADNSIQSAGISGPFTVGTFEGSSLLVPANEVLRGTPIAATTLGNAFQGIRVYFVSPNYTLSEYVWTGTSWVGGPSCNSCITTNQFAVQPGSTVMYAMGNAAGS